jgi:hypothetical protein
MLEHLLNTFCFVDGVESNFAAIMPTTEIEVPTGLLELVPDT